MTEATTVLFSMSDLSPFERPGVEVTTTAGRAGCRVTLPGGEWLSVQWGGCMYSSNYDERADADVPDATTAEIAVSLGDGKGLVTWVDGDTVQGWCTMERVQHVLDMLIAGTLMRADDGHVTR